MGEPRDLDWEAGQIDRALDFVNVTFGALFGAYIGIQVSDKSLSIAALTNLVFILANMTIALFNYRVAWHVMAGTIDAQIRWNVVAILGSCIAMGATLRLTQFDVRFFLFMFGGWLVTSLVLTIGYILKRIVHE